MIGAGPAGLAFATTAASRGHQVTLFDAADQIGGQFNIAKQIPGKEEFHETLRYFRRQLALREVTVRLGVKVEAADLSEFDEVILACGIVPRTPDIPGIGHAKVLSYLDVLRDKTGRPAGGDRRRRRHRLRHRRVPQPARRVQQPGSGGIQPRMGHRRPP